MIWSQNSGRRVEEPSSAVARHPWVCSEPRQVTSALGHKDPCIAVDRKFEDDQCKLTVCSEIGPDFIACL